MNQEFLNKVESKELLMVITDESGDVLWESAASPASGIYKDYYKGVFEGKGKLTIYANQAGLAVALLAHKLPVETCHAVRMSAVGLKEFDKAGISYDYKELIPLVRSSKNEDNVCPIELFLSEHPDAVERWTYLEDKFKNHPEAHTSCEWKPKK